MAQEARTLDPTDLRLLAELQRDATVIPIAWVADARLVSRRLRGWRRDELGAVDYAAVVARARAPSRSR